MPWLPRHRRHRRADHIGQPGHSQPAPAGHTLSQEQFAAMMRSGVKPDGQPFPEAMPWQNASKMNDDDLAALYAYLTAPAQ